MKYICYTCECGCQFAISEPTDDGQPICPTCEVYYPEATGEVMIDPKITMGGNKYEN